MNIVIQSTPKEGMGPVTCRDFKQDPVVQKPIAANPGLKVIYLLILD